MRVVILLVLAIFFCFANAFADVYTGGILNIHVQKTIEQQWGVSGRFNFMQVDPMMSSVWLGPSFSWGGYMLEAMPGFSNYSGETKYSLNVWCGRENLRYAFPTLDVRWISGGDFYFYAALDSPLYNEFIAFGIETENYIPHNADRVNIERSLSIGVHLMAMMQQPFPGLDFVIYPAIQYHEGGHIILLLRATHNFIWE